MSRPEALDPSQPSARRHLPLRPFWAAGVRLPAARRHRLQALFQAEPPLMLRVWFRAEPPPMLRVELRLMSATGHPRLLPVGPLPSPPAELRPKHSVMRRHMCQVKRRAERLRRFRFGLLQPLFEPPTSNRCLDIRQPREHLHSCQQRVLLRRRAVLAAGGRTMSSVSLRVTASAALAAERADASIIKEGETNCKACKRIITWKQLCRVYALVHACAWF